jgi:hypothetical protein
MFQAAIDAGAPVAPVSLRYLLADGQETTVAAFVGDEPLLSSLRPVVSVRRLWVSVHIHPALHPGPGASRRVLARAAEAGGGSHSGGPHIPTSANQTPGGSRPDNDAGVMRPNARPSPPEAGRYG